jgi:uncharacterized surface protein with fasciclin (FAS1) repeats
MTVSFMFSALLATSAAAQNVVDVAVSLPETFSALVDLVAAADLADTLSTTEDITVFAPVNDAFAALDPVVVRNIQTEPWKAHLQDILKYHVLGDAIPSTAITDGLSVETLNGDSITLAFSTDGNVTVNDESTVILPDVAAENGIIHVSIILVLIGQIMSISKV